MKDAELQYKEIDSMIREACRCHLNGTGHGSAHGCHPEWIRRGQLLFVSHHHIDRHCHIAVLTSRTAAVTAGCNNPAAYGDPWPRVDAGQLVVVWNGSWLMRGPWQEVIPRVIADIQRDVKKAQRKVESEQKKSREKLLISQNKIEQSVRDSFVMR